MVARILMITLTVYADGYIAFLLGMLAIDWWEDMRRRRVGYPRVGLVYFSMTDYLLIPFTWPALLWRGIRRKR